MSCGYKTLQWVGRCPGCGDWGSLSDGTGNGQAQIFELGSLASSSSDRLATGIGELDRCLGGGLVSGSVVLLAGEPGVGKSTLMLQAARGLQAAGFKVLLVCGEESPEQVASRSRRLGGPGALSASAQTQIGQIESMMQAFDVVIVDSIQTLIDPDMGGEAGSVSQVRTCAQRLVRRARSEDTAVLLIGHVTKDGAVAGPRVLEHLVDAVLTFESGGHSLRTLRGVKNRFGSTPELGIFEMGDSGFNEVPDASHLFAPTWADRRGAVVGCIVDGHRPIAVEVQTLVMATQSQMLRRVGQGIDQSRLGVVLAILDKRARLKFAGYDVYVSIAGGLKAQEPGVDLALALALAGARCDKSLPKGCAAIGELGLSGEIRPVRSMVPRMKELKRLGFDKLVVPHGTESASGLELIPAKEISEVQKLLE